MWVMSLSSLTVSTPPILPALNFCQAMNDSLYSQDAWKEREPPKVKARCRSCSWLNWDFITSEIVSRPPGEDFCGLHGRTPVDPDGLQPNLNRRGGCGYNSKHRQLTIDFFDEEDNE